MRNGYDMSAGVLGQRHRHGGRSCDTLVVVVIMAVAVAAAAAAAVAAATVAATMAVAAVAAAAVAVAVKGPLGPNSCIGSTPVSDPSWALAPLR